MAANRIREEYLFPNASVYVRQVAHSACIHKQIKEPTSLVTRCSCD